MTSEDTTNTATTVTDKRGLQFSADTMGLAVCGMVAAIIWFFAVQSFASGGLLEVGAIDCATAATYGVSEGDGCTTP